MAGVPTPLADLLLASAAESLQIRPFPLKSVYTYALFHTSMCIGTEKAAFINKNSQGPSRICIILADSTLEAVFAQELAEEGVSRTSLISSTPSTRRTAMLDHLSLLQAAIRENYGLSPPGFPDTATGKQQQRVFVHVCADNLVPFEVMQKMMDETDSHVVNLSDSGWVEFWLDAKLLIRASDQQGFLNNIIAMASGTTNTVSKARVRLWNFLGRPRKVSPRKSTTDRYAVKCVRCSRSCNWISGKWAIAIAFLLYVIHLYTNQFEERYEPLK